MMVKADADMNDMVLLHFINDWSASFGAYAILDILCFHLCS